MAQLVVQYPPPQLQRQPSVTVQIWHQSDTLASNGSGVWYLSNTIHYTRPYATVRDIDQAFAFNGHFRPLDGEYTREWWLQGGDGPIPTADKLLKMDDIVYPNMTIDVLLVPSE